LAQQHGDVAGEIAVALVAGVLDDDVLGQLAVEAAVAAQGGEGVGDELLQVVFHRGPCTTKGAVRVWPRKCATLSPAGRI